MAKEAKEIHKPYGDFTQITDCDRLDCDKNPEWFTLIKDEGGVAVLLLCTEHMVEHEEHKKHGNQGSQN